MDMKILPVLVTIFALALAGCGQGVPGEATAAVSAGTVLPETISPLPSGPAPSEAPGTQVPTLPSALSPAELRYRLLAEYPDFFYCDPDYYPVARDDEVALARERFPEIQANAEEFQAILEHTGLGGMTSFTDQQKLLVYQEHKKLAAIPLELAGETYRFQLRTADTSTLQGFYITGTIDSQGRIEEQERTPGFADCPICLAARTRIDTPHGLVAVEDIQPGDLVWTLDRAGERVSEPVLEVGQTAVPAGHRMVHLLLEDGRELLVSPGHPTADGRRVGDLQPGDLLDGARVVSLAYLPYEQRATYDLLPAGDTGLYWAGGILLGSTLNPE